MKNKPILNTHPLGFHWKTQNPFIFCVHHLDHYPAGNEEMGPAASLSGRNLGQDFVVKDGWRMYHGERIPGFPTHPHRGFETVTIVLKGFVDHSDSHGASGRYGEGDVQWMTAGAGLQHAEMFPLLNTNDNNLLELFQIWINLPKKDKFVPPHYKMLWAEDIPLYRHEDSQGKKTEVKIIAGKISTTQAPAPAPDSYAADIKNEVGIWLIKMEARAQWQLPLASSDVKRSLYFYKGSEITMAGMALKPYNLMETEANQEILIENGSEDAYLLILQGKPIDEPVVQYGPFVMNTQAEIQQAFDDYQATQFGGWPWDRYDHVHPRERGRFAKYADGKEEIR